MILNQYVKVGNLDQAQSRREHILEEIEINVGKREMPNTLEDTCGYMEISRFRL